MPTRSCQAHSMKRGDVTLRSSLDASTFARAACRFALWMTMASLVVAQLAGCESRPHSEQPAPETKPLASTQADATEPVGGESPAAVNEPPVSKPAVPEPAAKPANLPRAATGGPSLAAADGKPAAPSPATEQAAKSPGDLRTPLIRRDELLGNPERAMARISADGKRLAWLAPVEGVLNVWVAPVDRPLEAKPVTNDKYRGVHAYFWAFSNKHILYSQDKGGDEDFHVYAVDLDSGETKDLTPLDHVAAQIEGLSEKFPDELLIGLNNRDPQFHDIYRVNIASGERRLVQENLEYAGFVTDDDYRVRFASKMTPDGGSQYYQPDGAGGWKEFLKIGFADSLTTSIAGFDKTGDVLYLLDSRDRDTAALVSLDLKTGQQKLIAENAKADVGGVLAHPTEKNIQAVSFDYLRTEWQILERLAIGE